MKLLMWLPGVDISQGLPHNLTVGPGDSCKCGSDKPKDEAGAVAGCMGVCIGTRVGSDTYSCLTDSGTPQGRGLGVAQARTPKASEVGMCSE